MSIVAAVKEATDFVGDDYWKTFIKDEVFRRSHYMNHIAGDFAWKDRMKMDDCTRHIGALKRFVQAGTV